jgi:hypothetical protein
MFFPFPCACPTSCAGEGETEMYFSTSPCNVQQA